MLLSSLFLLGVVLVACMLQVSLYFRRPTEAYLLSPVTIGNIH
jgi:hypothetical protein